MRRTRWNSRLNEGPRIPPLPGAVRQEWTKRTGDPVRSRDVTMRKLISFGAQLLSCHREHDLAVDILQGGGKIALQVVESAEPKAKPDVRWAQAGIEGLRLSSTQPDPQGGMNRRLA